MNTGPIKKTEKQKVKVQSLGDKTEEGTLFQSLQMDEKGVKKMANSCVRKMTKMWVMKKFREIGWPEGEVCR